MKNTFNFILLLMLLCTSVVTDAQNKLKTYIFMSEECPVCLYMVNDLRNISKEYQDISEFIFVFPKKNSTLSTAEQFIKEHRLEMFKILLDPYQDIAKSMNASITPEAFVTGRNNEILYQGRINNAYYAPGKMRHGPIENDLNNALRALNLENVVDKPWPNAIGCYITFVNSITND